MQDRIILVELFAKLISDDFEASTQPVCVEGYGCFAAHDAVALVPPRSIGIAHDLADTVVEQQRLYRAEEWKD